MKLYNIGYQQANIENYVASLREANIGIVLDVRENPWSYKKGFSRNDLCEALSNAGIDYLHIRSAGNPLINRKSGLTNEQILVNYQNYLDLHSQCLDELYQIITINLAANKLPCLTCFERLPRQCHRSILIEALRVKYPNLESIDLFVVQTLNKSLW
jgi:uncharacterized protein (DUF488 family)